MELLRNFFIDELGDIYYAEHVIAKALPKMAKAATSTEVKYVFDEQVEITKEQITRLERVFNAIGETPKKKKCDAIADILNEACNIIDITEKDTITRDAGLVIAAQKAEHYQIATYGGLVQLAHILAYDDAAQLLYQTLKEEKDAGSTLGEIAEGVTIRLA